MFWTPSKWTYLRIVGICVVFLEASIASQGSAEESQGKARESKFSILVTNAEGDPVKRIVVEPAIPWGDIGRSKRELTPENAGVDFGEKESTTNASEDGVYRFEKLPARQGVWISSKGSARSLFIYPDWASEKPVAIQLFPASRIEITVVDEDQAPLSKVAVVPDGEPHAFYSNWSGKPPWAARTDRQGKIVFDKLAPGKYTFPGPSPIIPFDFP